jgi:hypothetical protein
VSRYNTQTSTRVLSLCEQPRTAAEIEEHFSGSERHLARYAIYNLVKRGQLRNLTEGKCGWGKRGRFVVTEPSTGRIDAPSARRVVSDGSDLARAWGLMA